MYVRRADYWILVPFKAAQLQLPSIGVFSLMFQKQQLLLLLQLACVCELYTYVFDS